MDNDDDYDTPVSPVAAFFRLLISLMLLFIAFFPEEIFSGSPLWLRVAIGFIGFVILYTTVANYYEDHGGKY